MSNLKIITMRDVEAENIKFLWYPYIAYGKITIVQGDPGDGKTTMMLSVAASVTRGLSVAEGGGNAASADVIFQTAEDGLADTIKPRLEQLGADCDRVHVIDESDMPLSLTDERIEKAILEKGAKLLILDPLQAYLGGSDMNGTAGIRPLMKALATVAENTGCAIVLIGHLNKKKGKSAYRGLGSIDITAAARSVLTVGRLVDVDENMRAFIQTKCNIAPTGKPQAFGLDPIGGLCWFGDYNITIGELLDGKKPDKGGASQFELAESFIKGILANGDVAANVVFARAEEAGYAQATLKRAKTELDIKSEKRGNEWFWVSKSKPIQPNQGDQEIRKVDTLDTLDPLEKEAG